MSNHEVLTAFASALEIGGPTPDGLVHITFTRAGIGEHDPEQATRTIGNENFRAKEIPVKATVVPVATIMVPFSVFKTFGAVFAQVNEALDQLHEQGANRGQNPEPATDDVASTKD
ncbi:hypothetical protein [Stenotrophomonas sp. CFBP 13725]|uniref:hypothetical protein n=1 Tax=Stenotrophomonas sp. CFBP 13725 TaxID=2775297 RepID=UPI0017801A93|nr:hypothetical protein [Stenotrophomonas sp. CFBP 13725]MBD8635641.1 hypothetical protein [Stenotrophomonas sp. CFBP 13725]